MWNPNGGEATAEPRYRESNRKADMPHVCANHPNNGTEFHYEGKVLWLQKRMMGPRPGEQAGEDGSPGSGVHDP